MKPSAITGLLLLAPLATFASSPAAHAQTPPAWKTVTDTQAGVRVSLPPGTPSQRKTTDDPETGGKIFMTILGDIKSRQPGYIVYVVRVDKKELDALRAHAPAGKKPIDMLPDGNPDTLIAGITSDAKREPKRYTIAPHPVTVLGMSGEDITFADRGANGDPPSWGRMRMLKTQTSLFFLVAAESKRTPAGDARIARFLDSFAVLPAGPSVGLP